MHLISSRRALFRCNSDDVTAHLANDEAMHSTILTNSLSQPQLAGALSFGE